MSEQLQLRRGTASQVTSGTPAQGEPWVDTTNNRVCIGDGATVGGWPAAKLAEVVTNTRTAVSDTAYTALSTDRMIAFTALTAARIVSLPASSTYPAGTRLLVVDETGNCSSTKPISIAPNGTDAIDGANSDAVIASPYGYIALESGGAGAWTIVDQMAAASAPNGANITFGVIETLVSGMSGASVNAATQIPANCIVFAVGARVVTTITGATSYEVGVSGDLSQFGSGLSPSAGSANYGLIGPTAFYSATTLALTSTGGNFTAGAVRLSIHYMLCGPSAS